MPVTFDEIHVGAQYDRPTLAKMWGYKSWAAISRGILTPLGQHAIVLFITEDKQAVLRQYRDSFDGEVLRMEGEEGHKNDERLINASVDGDEVHLFYRRRHHSPFIYHGRFSLEYYQRFSDRPTLFVFRRQLES